MEPINLDDYYSGGYFLLRGNRPTSSGSWGELWPDGDLISLSECMCPDRFSVDFGWSREHPETAVAFGIPEARYSEFADWCASGYEEFMDSMSTFRSPDAARKFIDKFNVNKEGLHLVGAALPKYLRSRWIERYSAEPIDEGISKRIRQGIAVEQGGEPFGYEVISFYGIDFSHSWLCSGIDKDMHQLYGFRPNGVGLIDSFEDAQKCYEWIAEDEQKGHRSEPEPYDFWLLISYPLD